LAVGGLAVLFVVQIMQQIECKGGQQDEEAAALEHIVAQQRNALAEAKVVVLHFHLFLSFQLFFIYHSIFSPCF
jgi:hypothetical protein